MSHAASSFHYVCLSVCLSVFLSVCLSLRCQESNSKALRLQSHDMLQGERWHHEEAPAWSFTIPLAPPQCRHGFCWVCLDQWSNHSRETGGYFQLVPTIPSCSAR